MKRRIFTFTIIILGLILIVGCNPSKTTTSNELKEVENEFIMPDEMPNDFSFSLKYGTGALNEINTFDNTYTKDLVLDGTITTGLKLTKKERNKIYQEMKEIEILTTVKNARYIGEDGISIATEPSSNYVLVVQMNSEIYKAHWSGNIYDGEINNKLGIFIYLFLHDGIIAEKSEYKGLPQISGSYQ